MKNLVSSYVDRFRQDRQKQLKLVAVLAALAVVVAGIVFWQLHSTGVAMTNETFCGMEEHTHSDDCYEEVLICDNDDEDHVHGDQCYARKLTCGLEEHTHTIECMSDENADLETAADWEATLPELTGNQAYDMVSVAQSQVGYSESEANFQVADDGATRQGYTRYGEWYGNAYGDWDAMFASFCLNYADVSETEFPESSGVYAWMTELGQDGLLAEPGSAPSRGDLVFLDADQNGEADTVAVVTGEDDGTLTVIQGNSNDMVEQYEIAADDTAIVAYGVLPAQEDAPEADFEVLDHMTQTIAEGSTDDGENDDGIMALDDEGDTNEKLNGDYAYLSNVTMVAGNNGGYAIETGTEPWDSNDNAGNDSSADNRILRTFDTATYSIDMTTMVRTDAPYSTYETGDLYFEFVVEGDSSQIKWVTGSMGWLESKHGVYTVSEESYEGTTYQVLRGYILLEPASGGHAIGNSTQSLSLSLQALSLSNGTKVTPQFTLFMAYNNVGLTNDQYRQWGTPDYVENGGPMVTFKHSSCPTAGHGDEYKILTAPEITISAAPRYNLYIAAGSTSDQVVTGLNFDSGNDLAVNKDAGEKYGRVAGYGIELQIVGKDSTSGLRGVEIPKNGDKISATFKLDLSSQYTANGNTYKTDGTTYDNVKTDDGSLSNYAPLIWSFEGNSSATTQQDEREIPSALYRYVRTVPYNHSTASNKSSSTWHYYCDDGGTWTIKANGDGTYDVTIEDCVVNMDWLPYNNPSAGSSVVYTYYDPTSINYNPTDSSKNDYWQVEQAVLSTAECWVIQPFYAHEKDDSSDPNSTYIAQVVANGADGTFNTYLKDSTLEVKDTTTGDTLLPGASGTSNQAKTSDDSRNMSMALLRPGTIQQHIAYLKYNYSAYNDPLTDGCIEDGRDWILQGNKLTIGGYLQNDYAEGEYTAVAYDMLAKFDDAFFEPESVAWGMAGGGSDWERAGLWAAKPDKSGWDHKGLKPNQAGYDEEMINATTDDLIYFDKLSDLKNAGYTCVGLLVEFRGPMTEQMNHMHYYIKGTTKADAEVDQVYMITHYAREWDKDDLASVLAEDKDSVYYGNKSGALNAILDELSGDQVRELVQKYIPSHADGKKYASDFPSKENTSWINGGSDGTSSNSDNIRNYKKAYYTDKGFDGDGTGVTSGRYYGDSCLLVGYQSGITLEVVQPTISQSGSESSKSVFDMDTNQTVVDYEASPFLTRNNGEETSGTTTATEVVVTITLPENLRYIDGSSYIGGTYSTNGEGIQGTVTGGVQLIRDVEATFEYEDYVVTVTLTVSEDEKGNEVLTYTFENVPVLGNQEQATVQLLESIFFSCEISSGAVSNGDQLTVTADIYCSQDKGVEPTMRENGESKVGITVVKDTAISLVKRADQSAVDVNAELGYTMDIGDNSDNSMTMVAVDNIPYNGDGDSTFTQEDCEVRVTEFSAYDTTAKRDLSGFFFFYTTNKDFAGKTSAFYPEGEYFVTDLGTESAAVNPDCEKDGWVEMEMKDLGPDDDNLEHYTYTDFPDEQVYAIVGVGIVEGQDDINMHVTLELTDPDVGDNIVNRLTQQHAVADEEEGTYEDLLDAASVRVVGRIICGRVWLDEDLDGGIRTGTYKNEQMLNGVKVTLQQYEDGKWVTAQKLKYDTSKPETAACVTETGTPVEGKIDIDGYYEFRYVSEGEFRIVFEGTGTGDGSGISYSLSDHDVTKYMVVNEDIDEKVNSKVIRADNLDYIDGITLSPASSISGEWDEVYSYENAGYTKGVDFTVNKIWLDVDGKDITEDRTTGSIKVKITANPNPTALDGTVELNHENDWTATITDLPYYDGSGVALKYSAASFTVKEIEGADGYAVVVGNIVENSETSYSVEITNQAGTELPVTGGPGTWIFTVAGVCLIGGAAAALVYRKRRAVRS